MTSQQKIEANRRNGKQGRGPGSRIGKAHSRVNARKHGLSITITADRNLGAAAYKIARSIVGKDDKSELMEQALIIAETELELQRISQARLAVIERAMTSADACRGTEITSDAFVQTLPALSRIERYACRAFSRRNKALARLTDLQMMLEISNAALKG